MRASEVCEVRNICVLASVEMKREHPRGGRVLPRFSAVEEMSLVELCYDG